MGGTPISNAYAIACGISTTPTVIPAIASDPNKEALYPLRDCRIGTILCNVLTVLGFWLIW
ncbi:hypothetical protein [Aquimarina sp. 2201CG5-10]|uniref:hypothetical protein n=1 Tax=Aquimarina callyspongiae TaxID=3098150 RepID=UPI002AB4FC18|nr:hypothetical protein [Aquimarina sp. 2201CG5-10]MDY8136173.1 hypothetical protein [Aquimarina sp. 2201CG5-10]